MSKLLYCPGCGAKNEDGASQCIKCGLTLKEEGRGRINEKPLPSANYNEYDAARAHKLEHVIPTILFIIGIALFFFGITVRTVSASIGILILAAAFLFIPMLIVMSGG